MDCPWQAFAAPRKPADFNQRSHFNLPAHNEREMPVKHYLGLCWKGSAMALAMALASGTPGPGAWAQSPQPTAPKPPSPTPSERLNWNGDPGSPDISGVWVLAEAPAKPGVSKEGWRPWPAPLKGTFADSWKKRVADEAAGKRTDDPIVGCVPPGMPRFITAAKGALLIIQSHQRVTMSRDTEGPRRIWLDGRAFPEPGDFEPFPKGTAIGRYDGADLVIESRGFFTTMPIDSTGIPHSDQMKIVERYHRADPRTLTVELTVTDPLALTKPLISMVTYKRVEDPLWEPGEFVCTPKTDYHPERYVH
jgi:hypothetical protein